MNNRVSLSDLIALVAEKQSVTKKDAELFLRDFVALISEQIESDDPVRIKDLGTFKLVKVNSRKSVNVNTGKETEIPAHYKMTFLPDKNLKEAVNRPFAHFENELLEDDVLFDNADEGAEGDIEKNKSSENNVVEISLDKSIEDTVPDEVDDTDDSVEYDEVVEPANNFEADLEIDVDANNENETIIKAMQEVERKPILKTMREQESSRERRANSKKHSSVKKDNLLQNKNIVALILLLVLVIGFLSYKLYENVFDNKKTAVPEVFNSHDVVMYDESDSARINKQNILADTLSVDKEDVIQVNTDEEDLDNLIVPKEEKVVIKPIAEEKTIHEEKAKALPQQTKRILKSSQTEPVTITTSSRTDLRSLSLDYYGDKSYWVYIYEENIDVVDDADNIFAGTQLVIPARSKYNIDVNNKASLQKAKDIESEMTGY